MLDLSDEQVALLERHYDRLLRWNRRLNLTAVTSLPEAVVRHYGESLFLGMHLASGSVVDVGTGAGLPGLPVAILRPDCSVTLVEAHRRKAVFLRESVRGLRNAEVLCARAESLPDQYDWMISRGVEVDFLLRLRSARMFALLVGAEDAKRIDGAKVIPLPWGQRRVLAVGSFT